MKTYDMVIIGGGPAGTTAAMTAAELGLDVLVVERDADIGIPVRCAEGVDHKGLTQFFEPDPHWIAAEISGYSLIAPDGRNVAMNNEGETGYILDRIVFDRMIAEKAARRGAKILTGVEAEAMSAFENGVRIVSLKQNGENRDVAARVVLAADGVESRAARWAGLDTVCPLGDMETCAQATLAGIDIDHHRFHLQFTREFAPGGYAWVFPKGEQVANVGLGIAGTFAKDRSPSSYLNAYIERFFPGASVVSRTVGGVQCSGGVKKLYADALLVAGDAGHMANPMTGGGIINGMIAGKLAAEIANDAIKHGDTSEKTFKPYQKACEKRIVNMNRRFHSIKEGVAGFTDDDFNAIADKVLEIPLEKRTPIRVLGKALMKNPRLLAVLAKAAF